MGLKITEEKENALFNRKEIKGFIDSEVVPSRTETSKILAEKFKVPWENIKIKKIIGKFGSKTFSVEANIYSSKQDKDSIELKKKKEKESEKKDEEVTEEKTAEEKPEQEQPEEQTEQKQTQTETQEPQQESIKETETIKSEGEK